MLAAHKILRTMQRYFPPLILLVLCLSCNSSTTDEKKIADIRTAFNLAISHHDLSAMDQYCSEDVIVLTSKNARSSNRDQYASFFEQDFKSKQDVIYIRTPQLIEVYAPWGMAAESGHWVGEWKADTTSIHISGSYYAKWKRVNNEWRICAEVFTALDCVGGRYCDGVK